MDASDGEAIRIVSANLQEGGIAADGSQERWGRSIIALRQWFPDVVCVQELAARRDRLQLRAHAWATANALGMIPVVGSEGGISGNHPAVLVSPHRLMILDDGPPPRQPGHDPAWCEALLRLVPAGPSLRVYSVHLPPGSAADQLGHAQRLASLVAQRGELAIIAGDWNSWSSADQITGLDGIPAHLRPARMHARPGQPLTVNYDVHDTLASVGLTDIAAELDPSRREPRELTATGINGGGRVDRCYVTREIWKAGAVRSYAQKDGGGSDHHMIMTVLGRSELAAATAPGFRP